VWRLHCPFRQSPDATVGYDYITAYRTILSTMRQDLQNLGVWIGPVEVTSIGPALPAPGAPGLSRGPALRDLNLRTLKSFWPGDLDAARWLPPAGFTCQIQVPDVLESSRWESNLPADGVTTSTFFWGQDMSQPYIKAQLTYSIRQPNLKCEPIRQCISRRMCHSTSRCPASTCGFSTAMQAA
jgi:hypothetical protein